ncbi:hypothetical protein BWI17_12540 [Betaproteobacteria bacterium GR16-43]|nr:hypothetical protein BWI17_12540 [Betaproteobacteria bacterium GR16-43]
MVRRSLVIAAVLLAQVAGAADPVPSQWPPSEAMRDRMANLQAILADPKSTAEARSSARAELLRLLRSPAAAPLAPGEADKARPARSSLDLAPGVEPLKPAPTVPAPPLATLKPAPRAIPPFNDPQTGRTVLPQGPVLVDPATGRTLPAAPGGYVDPATGRFIPAR